jgi:hypothetical protein
VPTVQWAPGSNHQDNMNDLFPVGKETITSLRL